VAAPMAMSLAAVMQHRQVLEESRLLRTEKQAECGEGVAEPDYDTERPIRNHYM
jgi:hypothetical protein